MRLAAVTAELTLVKHLRVPRAGHGSTLHARRAADIQLTSFVTYDKRLAEAAEGAGLRVDMPAEERGCHGFARTTAPEPENWRVQPSVQPRRLR